MGDLFHDRVPDGWINLIMDVMRKVPNHKYLVLTKRASRMNQYFTDFVKRNGSVPENLWIGVSAEDQKRADERLPLLLETPAAHRFLSVEPLLEHVNLSLVTGISTIDWVITGGESGRQARFMEADWARAIRDQCKQYAIPFYMKQMSRKAEIPVDLEIQQLPIGLK
jgi:protein gp37